MSKQEVEDIDTMREAAEKKIQKILIDLEYETGETIDFVNIDVRLYANCATEIYFIRDKT